MSGNHTGTLPEQTLSCQVRSGSHEAPQEQVSWASGLQVAFILIPDERPWVRFTLATPHCRSHHLRHTVPGFLGGLELETGLITKPGGLCVL